MKRKPEKIILASSNKKKVAELQTLLHCLGITIVTQSSLGIIDAEENGLSFVENAIIKARHASLISGLPAIADDSGIEVDALNGEPGIYSARFSSKYSTVSTDSDMANNQLLLEKMKGVADEMRTARFQCVLVYLRHPKDPTPLICQGSWEGKILHQTIGENGFGYDPLFYVPTHHCSAAELSVDEKSRISHRGQTMEKLLVAFRCLYG